jgi:hypothetical protein
MRRKFPDGRSTDDIYRTNRFFGLRDVLKGISEHLRLDFKKSSVIDHSGDMGEERELFLKRFLLSGHLPGKYSVSKGHGKVISSLGHVSLQTDLLLYDGYNCPVLRDGESHQFFPIESVYAAIQVKSRLSKSDFLDAAKNIASVKRIAEDKAVTKHTTFYGGAGMAVGIRNPLPFGAIFAYSLHGNSLKSLSENMAEYHAKTDPKEWVNLVCILDEGVIYNMFGPDRVLDSRDIIKHQGQLYQPNALHSGKDALLDFYLAMMGALGMLDLIPPPLHVYVDLPVPTDSGHSYKMGHDIGDICARDCSEHGLYEPHLKKEWIEKLANFLSTSPKEYPPSVYLAKEFGQTQPMQVSGVNVDEYMPAALIYTENGIDPFPLIQMKLEDGRPARQIFKLEFDGQTVFIPSHFIGDPENLLQGCPKC